MTSHHSKTYFKKGAEVQGDGLTLNKYPLRLGKWKIEANEDEDDENNSELCIKYNDKVQVRIVKPSPDTPMEPSSYGRFFMVDPCDIDISKGMIVSSTGQFFNFDYTQAPTINQSYPAIRLTHKNNDPTILGVIVDYEKYIREYEHGPFRSSQTQKDRVNRVIVATRGIGSVWVIDKGGVLSNGDYLTSSGVKGYCMRQIPSDILCNYTLGKVTHDCNFDPEYKVLQRPISFDKNGPVYEPLVNDNGECLADFEYELKYVTENGEESTSFRYEQDLERVAQTLVSQSDGDINLYELLSHPSRKVFRACLVGYIS